MSEVSVFPNGAVSELIHEDETYEASGGYAPLLAKNSENEPAHVDALRGVFITSTGNEITLSGKHVNELLLERITNEGKPKIPRKEVLLLGKYKEVQANASDPDYLALLTEWDAERNIAIARYLINIGIIASPPQSFVDEYLQIMPNANAIDMKYFYVGSLVPKEDFNTLIDAIMARNIPTAKGIQSAANFSA